MFEEETIILDFLTMFKACEPFQEKTNIMDSALCIEPNQLQQSAQTNPGHHSPKGIEV